MHLPATVTDVITSNSFSTVQEFSDPLTQAYPPLQFVADIIGFCL
jgi:hypothetical protein